MIEEILVKIVQIEHMIKDIHIDNSNAKQQILLGLRAIKDRAISISNSTGE